MRRALLLAAALAVGDAAAHVAPSVDDNNRYLKLTPQADRVRLAYTVFFGEVPGAAIRPTLDENHDSSIDDAEAQRYGDRVAADVLASLELAVDGVQQRLAWQQVSVGLGSPQVAAGAFAVDMIVYVCLARARGRHAVLLRDRFRVSQPGETEVLVEDGPGIRIERARIGSATAPSNDFKFVGPGGPLGDDGLDVGFVADDHAPRSGACAGTVTTDDGERRLWPWLAAGALVVLGALAGYRLRKRAIAKQS